MDSGLQERDERHLRLPRRNTASKAVILVLVLLLSTSVMSISGSIGNRSGRVAPTVAHSSDIDLSSITFVASPSTAFVNQTVTFYANASSTDSGATLIFTIFYNYYLYPDFSINPDSPVTVNTTGSPGSVVQTHVYTEPGNWTDQPTPYYYVILYVTDGITNETSLMPLPVSVFVPPVNTPPRFLSYPICPSGARANESQRMSAFVTDNNSDTVTMSWDFGDGSHATNVTVASPTGVYINQTHTWSPRIPGVGNYNATYFMNVSVTDGTHPPVNHTSIAIIHVGDNTPPNLYAISSKGTVSDDVPVIFTANASDLDGDPLTWTFNYSDGTVQVFHTGYTSPDQLVWKNATHSFAAVGTYNVNISVSDALVPNQVGDHNRTSMVLMTVVANSPPTITTIDMSPAAPIIVGTLGYVNVSFSVQAFDPDGDVMTVTWDFSGGDIRTNVSSGGSEVFRFSQEVRYTDVGNFSVSLTVTDGHPGNTVQRSMVANISSDNHAPEALYFGKGKTAGRDFAAPNETVTFTVILTDREHDSLNVSLDFGDGSPKMYWNNLTDYLNGNITLVVNHIFVKKGIYTAALVLTDNKVGGFNHTRTWLLTITVDVPPVVVHHYWDWWDYTSLALVMMIPILSIAWTLENRRHRRQIEDQGMTYDEWKLRKEVDLKGLNK